MRGDHTHGDDFARLADHRFRRQGHRGELIGEAAAVIGPVGMDQRKVCSKRRGIEPLLAVDLDDALAFGGQGAEPRPWQNATEPKAAGTDALGKRTLRDQLHVDLVAEHALLGQRVETDVRCDDAADETRGNHLSDADAAAGGIVGDHSEIAFAGGDDRVNEPVWRADAHEATNHKCCAVRDHCSSISRRDGFFHRSLISVASPGPGVGIGTSVIASGSPKLRTKAAFIMPWLLPCLAVAN